MHRSTWGTLVTVLYHVYVCLSTVCMLDTIFVCSYGLVLCETPVVTLCLYEQLCVFLKVWFGVVSFPFVSLFIGISTFVGYLISKPSLLKNSPLTIMQREFTPCVLIDSYYVCLSRLIFVYVLYFICVFLLIRIFCVRLDRFLCTFCTLSVCPYWFVFCVSI